MDNKVFIPQKIVVGYQNREGTYTGKLTYIIYYDAKGKLRKETSWNSWRDHEIEFDEYENKPTSGFVLNKAAGGVWGGRSHNHRQAKVRVYDPRDFEIEIDIPNLLYVLDNANSIRGKGLEGNFVYGWDGKDLILIPTSAPDYEALKTFSTTLYERKKLKGADLVLGGTYLTKKNEECVYLGRFDLYQNWYDKSVPVKNKGKYYFFKTDSGYVTFKYPSQGIIATVSESPVANYAELMDDLEYQEIYSPFSHWEYIELDITEIYNTNKQWRSYVYMQIDNKQCRIDLYFNHKEKIVPTNYYGGSFNRDKVVRAYHKVDPDRKMTLTELHEIFHFSKRVARLKNGKLLKRGK